MPRSETTPDEPGESVREAAARLLRLRLGDVVERVRTAVGPGISADPEAAAPEGIHQLRVACRRAAAALRAFRPVAPGRRVKQAMGLVRQVRDACGAARDLDVLRQRLDAAGELPPELDAVLAEQRRAAQQPIAGLAARPRVAKRLAKSADKLLKRLEHSRRKGARKPFAEWALRDWRQAVDTFVAAIPDSGAGPEALHDFRIALKRLRYRLELLKPALGHAARKTGQASMRALQDRLGLIADHRAAAEMLGSLADQYEAGATRDALQRQSATEAARSEALAGAFHAWWTEDRAQGWVHRLARPGRPCGADPPQGNQGPLAKSGPVTTPGPRAGRRS